MFLYLIYCFAASCWLKTLYSLFVLIFKSQKIIKKIENRKKLSQMNYDNIASKNINYRKKIESIGPDYYRIALSHRT